MRKGIMFTTDAILALIAVMLFLAWIPYQMSSQAGNQIYENISDQARDKAITSFYKGNPSTNIEIDEGAEFGKCVAVYSIDPSVGVSDLITTVYCEET